MRPNEHKEVPVVSAVWLHKLQEMPHGGEMSLWLSGDRISSQEDQVFQGLPGFFVGTGSHSS